MKTNMPKPRLFIGSSAEARELALAIQYALKDIAEAVPWSQGIFRLGSMSLDALLGALDGFDFAAFIFSPDDVTKMRESEFATVRDNVVFELGLFMGKLGARRSFFVIPMGISELHVPSDLLGVTAAKYDPHAKDLRAAVAQACFEIREEIKHLGLLRPAQIVLYDLSEDGSPAHFKGVQNYIYKDGKRVSGKAQGSFRVEGADVLKVERLNTEGKYEIQLRRQGPGKPSFSTGDKRVIRVSCEARVEGSEHTVRFLLKDEKTDKWIDKEKETIKPSDWKSVEIHLWVGSHADFLFRIDDEDVKQAPSSLYIRNLRIIEERA